MTFKMQKVLHLALELEKKKPKLDGKFIVTEKIEGWYVTFFFNAAKNTWELPKSSANREIPAFAWMGTLLDQLPKPKEDTILITEAYIKNSPFHITNGRFNRSVGDCYCYDVVFKCHDLVKLHTNTPAYVRGVQLNTFISEMTSLCADYFQMLPVLRNDYYDHDEWMRLFDKVASAGGEGIVAKRSEAYYSFGKRNADLLKVKLECTVDCLAIALSEGIGEKGYPSLTLLSKRKNGTVISTVISKHADQDAFRADSSLILGKVVTIKGMETYEDGQIRQPVFSCVRNDKQDWDYE